MFKATRWRSGKNRNKAVFKLQFQVTQVPQQEWETMMVVLVPVEAGRATVRSERVPVIDGMCQWANPIYETVKLIYDAKAGKINGKVYQVTVWASGSTKAGVLGEVNVNLAEYAEVFKPSTVVLPLKGNAGALLHVTIQRMQADGEGREANGNGDSIEKPRRKTLESQLSKCDDEEVGNATNGLNSVEDCLNMNSQAQMKFPSSRNISLRIESNGNLQKSHSFDAISASGSDISSGRYTPKESGIIHNIIQQDTTSFLSPLSNKNTPKMLLTSSGDWSGSSAPDRSSDGSNNTSGETGLQDSDDDIEKLRGDIDVLTRKLEVSELELQTLRKQIAKESRRGQDLSKEISTLKEEKEAIKKESEELKAMEKSYSPNMLLPDGEDPWSLLEELKRELNHEKNLNTNLRLQLQKTQESNSELLLAIKDLDEMLEQKGREVSCMKCSSKYFEAESGEYFDMPYKNGLSNMQNSGEKPELYAPDVLMNKDDGNKVIDELEKKIIDLNNEVELYKKDREELEVQMEQLALDYEILKQENHDVSSKLEQTQLQEQLRMQYECSAHLAVISDLEAQVESLEKELQKQAEEFDADIDTIVSEKIEQEQRAIKAEDALTKARWYNAHTAEHLQEEFRTFSLQMSSTFNANERLFAQTLKEASELRLQKSWFEEELKKSKEELANLQGHYHEKFRQLLSLLSFKSKETDRLTMELKNKSDEIQSQKNFDEANELQKKEDMISCLEQNIRDRRSTTNTNDVEDFSEEVKYITGTAENRDCLPSPKAGDKTCRHNMNGNSKELFLRNLGADPGKYQECFTYAFEQNKIYELLSEMALLEERNKSMEAELKEMQERYSEISLKFAEVEGERQQLEKRAIPVKFAKWKKSKLTYRNQMKDLTEEHAEIFSQSGILDLNSTAEIEVEINTLFKLRTQSRERDEILRAEERSDPSSWRDGKRDQILRVETRSDPCR
ncbi:hypothetical protein ACMD2_03467 [Ananas comosus]|uniref:C2 NT-type domain-containing protein n=1 Tax=Ananas comosus TaxID=4615 RepID=A0A199V6J8_ANACO|nr:hypothetical protein ACMD2_03467 [Ananas comosus]